MNLVIFIVVAFALFVGYDAWRAHQRLEIATDWKGYKTMNYRLNGKNYRFLVADTQEKQTKGLMNVRSLKGVDGMIFVFRGQEERTFWNENTLMDLDVYWLSEKKVVGQDFLPSVEKNKSIVVISSPPKVDTVIEIPRRS